MLKAERRTYRRSPGRQYGYDYDPLRSKHPTTTGHLDDAQADERRTSSNRGGSSLPTTGILAPRPDPRRTRQLLRQNILASKARSSLTLESEEAEAETEAEMSESDLYSHEPDQNQLEEEEDPTLYRNRYLARRGNAQGQPRSRMLQPHAPAPSPASLPAPRTRRLPESEGIDEEELVEWEPQDVDPDIGYEDEEEDPLDQRLGYSQPLAARPPVPRRASSGNHPTRSGRRRYAPEYDEDEEDELESRPRRKQKKGITRRSLLWGLGLAAVGGTAVAAIELGPKIPQTLENAGTNIEHQLEEAFNKGVAAGAESVRKEFITALDSMEGVSLQAAVEAAHLTRMAYDVFVSPLVTLAATITGDFLTVTLRALQTARGWLARIYQDNDTLAALQTVLQTWIKQVNSMPKKLQTITDTDLDGAQAYLRSLQHKLQEEQARLNQQQTPATPTTTPKPKPTTKPKS